MIASIGVLRESYDGVDANDKTRAAMGVGRKRLKVVECHVSGGRGITLMICVGAPSDRAGGAPSLEEFMAEDVGRDQLALIRIEGMHCHKCEQSIQRALLSHAGVREVEVDFASGQASVLFERGSVTINQLMDAVNDAGYHASGFTQSQAGRAAH